MEIAKKMEDIDDTLIKERRIYSSERGQYVEWVKSDPVFKYHKPKETADINEVGDNLQDLIDGLDKRKKL